MASIREDPISRRIGDPVSPSSGTSLFQRLLPLLGISLPKSPTEVEHDDPAGEGLLWRREEDKSEEDCRIGDALQSTPSEEVDSV